MDTYGSHPVPNRIISITMHMLRQIPVNLIDAQTPEHCEVIVNDFINQIGLDSGTTSPDVRFGKVVQRIGAQVMRGVGVHVARLELELCVW